MKRYDGLSPNVARLRSKYDVKVKPSGTTIVPPLTALPSASPETGAMLFNQ